MYLNIYVKKKVAHILCISFLTIVSLITALIIFSPRAPAIDSGPSDSVNLPIIMYHGIVSEKKHQGKFVISPNDFEGDLRHIKESGYNTIVVKDLIDYVYNDKPLPDNPIMLTFDDGYYNNYHLAFPLLKKYESKMVLSPIGYHTDKYSEICDEHDYYSHVTWEHINEMIKSGLVEIQNHSYNMHSNKLSRIGCKRKKGESLEEYKKVLVNDLSKMQSRTKEMTGIEPTTFVYPFGAVSDVSVDIIKQMGFKATFVCYGKTNTITKDPECLYGLCRYLRPNSISSKKYFSKIFI